MIIQLLYSHRITAVRQWQTLWSLRRQVIIPTIFSAGIRHIYYIYEGGHRIPLIVRWTEKIKPGGRCDRMVCLSDFMATTAYYFGTKLPDNAAEDSVSNLSLWFNLGSAEVRNDVVHQALTARCQLERVVLSLRCVLDPKVGPIHALGRKMNSCPNSSSMI